jgi:hypothetical protein
VNRTKHRRILKRLSLGRLSRVVSVLVLVFVPPMCEPVADAATDIPCDRYGCRLHRRDILRPLLFCVPERDDAGREAVQELGIYELVYVT